MSSQRASKPVNPCITEAPENLATMDGVPDMVSINDNLRASRRERFVAAKESVFNDHAELFRRLAE